MTTRREDDEDSVFIVADKVLRMQVEWMVQHGGVRRDFPVLMQSIWWSYLAAALPDVADGVEQILLSEPAWLQRLREVDLAQLFDIPPELVARWMVSLERTAFPEAKARDDNKRIYKTQHTKLPRGYLARKITLRLRHQRLLALICLGLQLCGEHTMISDLLRWIRTLQFPYICLHSRLTAEELVSYSRINENREICAPLYSEIEWLTAMLGKTLELNASDFPPVYVAPVVARFVEELNLPKAMVGFIMGVAELVHTTQLQAQVEPGAFQGNAKRSRGVEAFSMACVVYAMRTMFGMDGENERKISEATIKLQRLLGDQVQLFNFRDWVGHMDYRRLLLFRHTHLLSWSSARAELFLYEPGTVVPVFLPRPSLAEEEEKWRMVRRLTEVDPKPFTLVVLPPAHRPFRAHTEALTRTYPRLDVDFGGQTIQHLLRDESMPVTWKIPSVKHEEAKECWARLRGAQIAGKDSCPYRAQNWVGLASWLVPPSTLIDEVPSYSMIWLLEVCAEIIEHSPERLLKEVLFLELALFPGHLCSRSMGKGSASVLKMRTG